MTLPYGYIYKVILPTESGELVYIGQKTSSYEVQHYWGSGSLLKKHFEEITGKCPKWCNKEYAESFGIKREVLAWAYTAEELALLEERFILEYKKLRNCINVYARSFAIDEQYKRNMTKRTVGTRTGSKNPMYGKTSPWKGKSLSEESRKKLSKSKTGKFLGGRAFNARAVICIDTGEIYDTLADCARDLGVRIEGVCAVAKGKYKRHKGHRFAYVEKEQ